MTADCKGKIGDQNCPGKVTFEKRITVPGVVPQAWLSFNTNKGAQTMLLAEGNVYYLTCDELLTMPADARLRVKRRRAERERLQGLCLPDVIDRAWRPLTRNSADS